MANVVKGLIAGEYNSFKAEESHIDLGKAVVQGNIFFVLDEETFKSLEQFRKGDEKLYNCTADNFSAPMTSLFKGLLGDTVEVVYERTGTWDGYGHGRESVTVKNPDDSLVYQWSHIGHCDGPGYSCSYSHGPWFKYGQWQGRETISEDAKLREVVRAFLARKASFADLKKAVE